MKGVVFTELLGFVGERFGENMVDDIIEDCPLSSGGAYTTVGTYDHNEMAALCDALAKRTGEPAHNLIRNFGTHLSRTFETGYPEFFARSTQFFDFLQSVEGHIHVEVRKLYPDAELPSFTVVERGDKRMVMDYRSPRRMSALAEGLIEGSGRHFGVAPRVSAQPLASDGQAVRLVIEID